MKTILKWVCQEDTAMILETKQRTLSRVACAPAPSTVFVASLVLSRGHKSRLLRAELRNPSQSSTISLPISHQSHSDIASRDLPSLYLTPNRPRPNHILSPKGDQEGALAIPPTARHVRTTHSEKRSAPLWVPLPVDLHRAPSVDREGPRPLLVLANTLAAPTRPSR